jgi:hypothetical protein
MHELLDRLTGGDRRSIGRSNEVVVAVIAEPSLFGVLFGSLWSRDPLIRMRAADALEKITAKHPEYVDTQSRMGTMPYYQLHQDRSHQKQQGKRRQMP